MVIRSSFYFINERGGQITMLTRNEIIELINKAITSSPLIYSTTRRSGSNGIKNPDEVTNKVLESLEKAGVLMLVEEVEDGDIISYQDNYNDLAAGVVNSVDTKYKNASCNGYVRRNFKIIQRANTPVYQCKGASNE